MTPEGYTRVYVGGLNETIKKEDLQMEFEKFGKLNKVWVAFNPPGFAFIEFFSLDEAEMACNSMNGTEIMGAKLRVEISRGRGRNGSRGNGAGGFRGNRPMMGSGGGRGFGGSRGASGGYRESNSYGGDQGTGSYHTGRAGGGGGGGGGGGRYRGRYNDSYSSTGRSSGGYVARNSYSQHGGGGYDTGSGDTNADYYSSGKDSSRYRSRSPAGRGSHRHLRECT